MCVCVTGRGVEEVARCAGTNLGRAWCDAQWRTTITIWHRLAIAPNAPFRPQSLQQCIQTAIPNPPPPNAHESSASVGLNKRRPETS